MGWFKRQIDFIKQGFKDIRDRKAFKKDILEEENNINSPYNDFNLKHNKKCDRVFAMINIPEDYERSGDDRQKMIYLRDVVKPINRYFEQYLNWGEYLVTSYYHFASDEPEDVLVYTYLVEWKFVPFAINRFKWWATIAGILLLISAAIVLPIVLL